MRRKLAFVTACLVAMLLPAGLAQDEDAGTIANVLASDTRFSMFVEALEKAAVIDELDTGGPFTVFAPTNAAFDELPEDLWTDIVADPARLEALVNRHLVPERLERTALVNSRFVTPREGPDLEVAVAEDGETILVDEALVTQADLPASNGVIHVIGEVLLPPQ